MSDLVSISSNVDTCESNSLELSEIANIMELSESGSACESKTDSNMLVRGNLTSDTCGVSSALCEECDCLKLMLKDAMEERDKAKADVNRLKGMSTEIERNFSELAHHCHMLLDERNELRDINVRLSKILAENGLSLEP